MNYETFRKLAKPVDSLMPYNGNDDYYDFAGYIFEDDSGLLGQIEVDDVRLYGHKSYHVIAERSEIVTNDFEEAVRWLWNNWSRHLRAGYASSVV
jgi:hypothetical protein